MALNDPLPPAPTYQVWLQRDTNAIPDTNMLMAAKFLVFGNAMSQLITTLGQRLEVLGAKMAKSGEFMKALNTSMALVTDDTSACDVFKGASEQEVKDKLKEYEDAGCGKGVLLTQGPPDVTAWKIYAATKDDAKKAQENIQTTITNDSSTSQTLQLLLSQLNSRRTTAMDNVSGSIEKFKTSVDTTINNWGR